MKKEEKREIMSFSSILKFRASVQNQTLELKFVFQL